MKKNSLSPLFFIIMISFVEIVYADPIKPTPSCRIGKGLNISIYKLNDYTKINNNFEFEELISAAKENKPDISGTVEKIYISSRKEVYF